MSNKIKHDKKFSTAPKTGEVVILISNTGGRYPGYYDKVAKTWKLVSNIPIKAGERVKFWAAK